MKVKREERKEKREKSNTLLFTVHSFTLHRMSKE